VEKYLRLFRGPIRSPSLGQIGAGGPLLKTTLTKSHPANTFFSLSCLFSKEGLVEMDQCGFCERRAGLKGSRRFNNNIEVVRFNSAVGMRRG
jgi:hypothetical protein